MSKFYVENPYFLNGAPRSGTTLLRLMLASHPQIAWCSEFTYVVRFVKDDGTLPDIQEYRDWLESNWMFLRKNHAIDDSLDYLDLVNSFLEQERGDKQIVGATVHEFFNRLILLWPNARFIHIIRDPRDVAPSSIQMGWGGNVWTALDKWIEAEVLWDEFKTTITPEIYIEVKYEDLIEKSVTTLSKICNFLGVEFTEKMFDYTKYSTYTRPDPKLINQWRKKLSEHEIQLIESRLGNYLIEKNYEPSGLPLIELSPLEKIQLKTQDWFYKKNRNIKMYGFGLLLSSSIAKRLNNKTWQKKVSLKMKEINDEYVKK